MNSDEDTSEGGGGSVAADLGSWCPAWPSPGPLASWLRGNRETNFMPTPETETGAAVTDSIVIIISIIIVGVPRQQSTRCEATFLA
jgi:hypothetical protein